ncbi:MAG: S9 family peptidase, partial [Thermoanaerobaculia bacterium]
MKMFLASLLLAASVVAQPLSIEDYATMPTLSSPRFSPDGNRVAYLVTRADFDRSAYISQIHVIDADGRNAMQLTRGTSSSTSPRWSPDGSRIAFLSERDGGKNAIWLIGATGGEAEKLTSQTLAIRRFDWSPDGKSIAFTVSDAPGPEEEKRIKEHDDARVVGEPRGAIHLHLIDMTSRQVRRLTKGPFSIAAFAWSPDGEALAIQRSEAEGLDDYFHADLYLLSLRDDNRMRPLVVRAGVDVSPQFSPDGKSIVFLSSGGVFDWLREAELYSVPMTGGAPRLLSKAYGRTPDSFFFSGDGRTIWFNGPWNSTSQLFRLGSDGAAFRDVSRVAGLVAEVDVRNGRAAFVYQTLNAPPELHISALDEFRPRPLTHLNDALRSRTLGETTLIRWKNPKDGLEIEGLLTLPPGYVAGRRYPTLTFVHGGPASRFDQGFLGYLGAVYAPQVLASRGFVVLRPNPRGTGGYGQPFRAGNVADWGGMDWVDINAGLDKLLADGIADPQRLGIMGWSYGGFMTAWAVGHSDRFKAISIGAPVVDLLSFHGTTDIREFIPNYFPTAPQPAASPAMAADAAALESLKGTPFSLELLRERSPLWHLKKTSAKVLIQHGEADDRVPLSQGTML